MTDLFDVVHDIVNEMTFTDLLVINVEDHFDVRAGDFVDDLEGFLALDEVIAGVIDQFIERFDDEGDSRRFEHWGCGLQTIDKGLVLLLQ